MNRMITAWFLVTGICLGLHAQSWAQDALGNGTALDNNLQVGSGGVNQPQAPPAYLNANDVITGNVSGLGYFRDDTGYGATYEFGDRLGGDDLFRFRARGLSSGASGLGQARRVYRSASTLGVGRAEGRDYSNAYLKSPGAAYSYSGLVVAPGPDAMTQQSTFLRSPGVTLVGESVTAATPDARDLAAQSSWRTIASPLLGVRRYQTPARGGGDEIGQPNEDEDQPGQRADPSTPDSDNNPYRVNSAVRTWPVSLELGRQIQGRVDPQRVGESPQPTMDARVAEIEEALFMPVDTYTAAPGQDAYIDLLRRIQSGEGSPQPAGHADSDNRLVPAEEDTADDPQNAAPPPFWTDDGDLDKPDDPSPEDVAAEQLARDRARGLDTGRSAQQNPTDGQDRFATTADGPLKDLLDTLNYDLPPVSSLAGTSDDQINQLIRQAQVDLGAGRYFKAESRYQQVLRLAPGYPLGKVGLIHAQLGAAMFHSAALNLRRLFELHPELIATRYEPALLPSPDRLKWVRHEIDKILELRAHGDPAILLAYIGYQTGSTDLIQQGLDLAGQHDPDDELLTLLRAIWLDRRE